MPFFHVRTRAIMACAVLLAAFASRAEAELLSPVAGDALAAGGLPGISRIRRLSLDRRALLRLRAQQRARVHDFPLGADRLADVDLERFDPFTAEARAEVVVSGGRHPLPLPDHAYFRGTVAGETASHVFLVAGRSRVHGFVISGGEVFPFGPDSHGRHRTYALRDADPARYPRPGAFCANDLEPAAVQIPPGARTTLAVPAVAAAPGTLKQADVAIETDQELRAKFSSDAETLDYLASLAAAATAIYERDVAVRLRFSYIRLWATADPWTATSTSAALGELRAYWNDPANDMAHVAGPRTVVHFVSGKPVQGGIAYIDVLCNASYGYGVSQVFGSFDLTQPQQIWDVEVFAHELGHNFGSPHSHCYTPPIDECYNAEPGCYAGPVVASRGTIMSYCHLLAGGLANIDLLFGDVVSARIGQTVAAAGCLTNVATSTTTTTATSTTSSTTSSTRTTTTTTTTTSRPSTTSTTTSSTTTPPPTTTSSTRAPSSTTTTTSTTTSSTTTRPPTTTTTTTSTTARPPTTTTTSASTSTTIRATTTSITTTVPTTTVPVSPGGDADGDGVPDRADVCPGSPSGDIVDGTGCSICPCTGMASGAPWPSRSAYLHCVRDAAARLDRARRVAALGHAQRSSCGRPAMTRCCLFRTPATTDGRCRIVRHSACAARAVAGRAVDLAFGSCASVACVR